MISESAQNQFRNNCFYGGLACAATVLCLVLANPFVNSPVNDDWAYSAVALHLAQKGALEYSGWGSPPVVFQSAWAALFIKLFGFSFNTLRLSTLPFSLGFVWLTYAFLRHARVQRQWSFLGVMTLAVSPIFIPLAASFMTEPQACFFGLLCLMSAIYAADTARESGAIGWMWVVALSGIIGGSSRQTVWIGPLIYIPYLMWVWRARRRFLFHASAALLLSIASLAFLVLRFSQKYGPAQISKREWPHLLWVNSTGAFHYLVSLLLFALFLCLPVLVCFLPLWKRLRLRVRLVLLVFSLFSFEYFRSALGPQLGVVPFLGDVVTQSGTLGGLTGLGERPVLLPVLVRYPLMFFFLLLLSLAVYFYRQQLFKIALPTHVAWLFGLFVTVYVLLLIPGALLTFCYDRYALPVLPVLLVCMLRCVQQFSPRVPALAWAALVFFAYWSTGLTHDYARLLQARMQAAAECVARGINPLHISSGLERDGWLQITSAGFIKTVAYGVETKADYNKAWWWYYTTAIEPDYVAITGRFDAVSKKAVVVVPYMTWAPPSKEAVAMMPLADIPKSTR